MASDETHTRDVGRSGERSAEALARGTNHILAIAIDEYVHQSVLYNCVKDASDLIGILSLNYTFAREHVRELFNQLATTENILAALDDLAGQLDEDDSLLLLFSGHGQVRNGIGFWIPVDARSFTSYLPVSTVRDYLEPIRARHVFVVADACFSGSFFLPTRSGTDWSAFTERHPSRYAVTAGRNQPVLDGSPGENSPFAAALKYRLNKAEDPVGAIMLSELVVQDVVRATEGFQTPRHGEINIKGNQHGQFYFRKKLAPTPEADPFIDIYFKNGGNLLPPGDRESVQEYFDEYDQRLNLIPDEEKARLRRLNTEVYLRKWGLSIRILKEKLKILGFYPGVVNDDYAEEVAEAIARFQRHHMMRQIDGYFGELTYERMVGALLMSGLARYPSSRDK